MRVRIQHLVSITLLSASLVSLPAQSPSSDSAQAPVFKTNARAVVVDVVVTRGGDEQVSGLHKQDFLITEDGKPQTIDFFEEHAAPALPPGAIQPLPPMPPNVYTNVPPAPLDNAVNVLLIDTLNTEVQDQSNVRKQILSFFKQMNPSTRVAIFTLSSKLRFVQGFTTDASLLLAAVNEKADGVETEKDTSFHSASDTADDAEEVKTMIMELGGHSDAGVEAMQASQAAHAGDQYARRVAMTLEALDYLARYLAGVPGRKNLIWFASSFPVTVFPTPLQRQQVSDKHGYVSQVKKTADLLTMSKVAVYPISAEGMMNDHWTEADSFGAGRANGSIVGEIAGDNNDRAGKIAAMEQLASDTGGKAFYNTNDLNAAMQHAIADGSRYYTLGYTPTNAKLDGKYRQIDIKMSAGKYKLAYRRGYNADDTRIAETAQPDDPLSSLLMRGLPSATQMLYGVRVVPVTPQPAPNATRAGLNPKLTGPFTRYSVDFLIHWNDVSFTPEEGGDHTGKINVGLMAYDRQGHAVNWLGYTQGMDLRPALYESIQKSGVPAHMEIDLPDTQVYLETGVYDWATGKAGTLEIPLHPGVTTAATAAKAAAGSK